MELKRTQARKGPKTVGRISSQGAFMELPMLNSCCCNLRLNESKLIESPTTTFFGFTQDKNLSPVQFFGGEKPKIVKCRFLTWPCLQKLSIARIFTAEKYLPVLSIFDNYLLISERIKV